MPRISELKQKFAPNEKLRAWYNSHTFGGTTKAKSLYIAGLRKKNFYYVAAAVSFVLVAGAAAGGIGIKTGFKKENLLGQAQAGVGAEESSSVTATNVLTVVSDGSTYMTTEVSSYLYTYQQGGGTTVIKTTDSQGKQTTVPASLSIVTSSGKAQTVTLLGSLTQVSDENGNAPTTIFGAPSMITSNGKVQTSIVFTDIQTTTGSDGKTITNVKTKPKTSSGSGQSGSSGSSGSSSSGSSKASSASASGSPSQSSSAGSSSSSAGSSSASSWSSSSSAASSSSAPPSSSSSSVSSSSSSSSASSSSASSSSEASSSSSAESSSSSGGGGDSGSDMEGEATFYTPGLGSCGIDSGEKDFVAAMSKILFDAKTGGNANNNPYCGKKALVKAASGGSKRFRRLLAPDQEHWAPGMITSADDYEWNSTTGFEDWQGSRRQRWSRQALLRQSNPKKRILEDLPATFSSDGRAVREDRTGPFPAGITAPPDPEGELRRRQAGDGGVTITIIDRCPVCKQYDLDLSPAAFDVIGNEDAGRIKISWHFLDS